eukprot:scaffold36187_cov135-Isochrysis_galbana.AAC.3
MAPRQLRLEHVEVDSTADKGAKRVRVDSTEEGSTQRTAGPLLTICQSSGSRHGTGVQLTPLRENGPPTDSTNNPLTTNCPVSQMVASSHDPFMPTAAELAGEDPGVRETDTSIYI